MKFSSWVEIGKAIKEVYDTTDTVIANRNAAQRARLAEQPFPPHIKVQEQLNANEKLRNKLKIIATHGLPAPFEPKIGIDSLLARPSGTGNGLQKFNDTLRIRAKHAQALQKKIQELASLIQEAEAKSRAARVVRDFWRDAFKAPLPDMGSVNKAEYFTYYQAFQKIAGSLSQTANAAERAKRKLETDLKQYKKTTELLGSNVQTFLSIL
jgi:DNA repair exonuclease SbcCD ATPase subunit